MIVDGENLMPSGKYIWVKLKDIPDSYLKWYSKQEWFVKSTYSWDLEFKEYIKQRLSK